MLPAMADATPTRDRSVLLGLFYITLAGILFPIMSGAAKLLGADYSSLQVSWARAFGHIIFLSALFIPRHGLKVWRTRRPGIHLIRSALLFTSNICFFLAITFIPIAEAASVSLTAPIIVAALAWPMLGERTTRVKIAAMALGFLGVLIVIRPGTGVFHPASLLVLVSATGYAVYQILTRRIAGLESPETAALFSSVIGAFGMLLVLPFVWQTPASWGDVGLFCSLGLLGGLGHYCVAQALSHAPANIIAPFQYLQLIGSVLVGWAIFGDLPDAWSWLGAAVITAAGLWLGWTQTASRATLPATPPSQGRTGP
jgi:drug/metabolite transporter (DMT)-like permease